jgi:hypothetical protein
MKTGIGIGVIAVATVLVAVFLATRASGPTAVEATVDADGGLSFYGEGDTQTAPLDIVSGTYRVYGACGDKGRFTVTLVTGDESERLLGNTGSVAARISRGATIDVSCPGRWWVAVADDPLP